MGLADDLRKAQELEAKGKLDDARKKRETIAKALKITLGQPLVVRKYGKPQDYEAEALILLGLGYDVIGQQATLETLTSHTGSRLLRLLLQLLDSPMRRLPCRPRPPCCHASRRSRRPRTWLLMQCLLRAFHYLKISRLPCRRATRQKRRPRIRLSGAWQYWSFWG